MKAIRCRIFSGEFSFNRRRDSIFYFKRIFTEKEIIANFKVLIFYSLSKKSNTFSREGCEVSRNDDLREYI